MSDGNEASCSGADGTCDRPAAKAGLCWGHWKRKMRGQTVSADLGPYIRDPVDRLFRTALMVADADGTIDNQQWFRVRERFRSALRKYVLKWAAGQLKGQPRRVPLVEKR